MSEFGGEFDDGGSGVDEGFDGLRGVEAPVADVAGALPDDLVVACVVGASGDVVFSVAFRAARDGVFSAFAHC